MEKIASKICAGTRCMGNVDSQKFAEACVGVRNVPLGLDSADEELRKNNQTEALEHPCIGDCENSRDMHHSESRRHHNFFR